MNPHQKKVIAEFFHPKTVELVLGDKHLSKRMKKEKMMTLFVVATVPDMRTNPPGSWIMKMDQNFREGKP